MSNEGWELGDEVVAGNTILGKVQDITTRNGWGEQGMTPHVHMEAYENGG